MLVGGQAASTIGDACYAVALPWYVLTGHGGAAALGTTLAAYGVAMGLVMLAPAGAFPVSVALTTAVVHTAGAAAAFPLAGALTATAILFGLSRTAFRDFAAEPGA